jgi:hypothetical protein
VAEFVNYDEEMTDSDLEPPIGEVRKRAQARSEAIQRGVSALVLRDPLPTSDPYVDKHDLNAEEARALERLRALDDAMLCSEANVAHHQQNVTVGGSGGLAGAQSKLAYYQQLYDEGLGKLRRAVQERRDKRHAVVSESFKTATVSLNTAGAYFHAIIENAVEVFGQERAKGDETHAAIEKREKELRDKHNSDLEDLKECTKNAMERSEAQAAEILKQARLAAEQIRAEAASEAAKIRADSMAEAATIRADATAFCTATTDKAMAGALTLTCAAATGQHNNLVKFVRASKAAAGEVATSGEKEGAKATGAEEEVEEEEEEAAKADGADKKENKGVAKAEKKKKK